MCRFQCFIVSSVSLPAADCLIGASRGEIHSSLPMHCGIYSGLWKLEKYLHSTLLLCLIAVLGLVFCKDSNIFCAEFSLLQQSLKVQYNHYDYLIAK